jgi:hypothetical protein
VREGTRGVSRSRGSIRSAGCTAPFRPFTG